MEEMEKIEILKWWNTHTEEQKMRMIGKMKEWNDKLIGTINEICKKSKVKSHKRRKPGGKYKTVGVESYVRKKR